MNVLVTGAKCMVGTALYNNLKNIRDRKNRPRSEIVIEEIYEYDLGSTAEELDESYQKSDFVFNLAGVNRPENPEDFMKGNFGFTSALLNCLKKHNHKAIIMLSSSIQHEPLGFHDYNCLQMNAFCVVNDSGTLSEESSIFPVQDIRFQQFVLEHQRNVQKHWIKLALCLQVLMIGAFYRWLIQQIR